jgi:hypothetical protein
MIKSLSAFAVVSVLACAVVAVPAFAPKVLASEGTALAKGDRLEIFRAEPCAQQTWPNLMSSCLRAEPNITVREARLITAQRR